MMQKQQRSRIIIVLCLAFLKISLCEKENHWLRGRERKISASHLCPHLKGFWKRNNDSLKCLQLSFKLPLMTCQTETEKKSLHITEPGTWVTSCFQLEEQAEPQCSQVSLSQVVGRRVDSERGERSKQWVYGPEGVLWWLH